MSVSLTNEQVHNLAKPLKAILEEFYADPKNEEAFQKWLKERPQSDK